MLGVDSLRSWFSAALVYQYGHASEGTSPAGAYYEFGVGWGGTLCKYLKALTGFARDYDADVSDYQVYGFVSFEGLPPPTSEADRHPLWHAGDFAHSEAEVYRATARTGFGSGDPRIHLVRGWFESTLVEGSQAAYAGHPPALVTVDTDYYLSTRAVLNWLRPMLRSGALFYFDDFWSFAGNPRYGQPKAIAEFNREDQGQLVPFPVLGQGPTHGKTFIFAARTYEYAADR